MRLLYRLYFQLQRLLRHIRAPVTLGCRALVVKDGKILLVRMTYIDGWYLPGGGVDRGESFEASVIRELEEECGLKALKISLFGLYFNTGDRRIDHIGVYVVDEFTGIARVTDPREIAEVGFFAVDALPEDTARGHRRRIEEFLLRTPRSQVW
jgi:ADP-ribose pyrophosphatase YjhB (NUDIX family)